MRVELGLLQIRSFTLGLLCCSYSGISADFTERLISELRNTSYNVENLTPDTTYQFSVTAVNSQGESEPTTVSVKTVPPSRQS